MKNKEMIPLTDEENKSYLTEEDFKCAKKDLVLMMIIKRITKSEIIVIILENIEELLIIFII